MGYLQPVQKCVFFLAISTTLQLWYPLVFLTMNELVQSSINVPSSIVIIDNVGNCNHTHFTIDM